MEDDELLAERQILCDQVGLLGEQGTDEGPDEPQKKHRHLASLLQGSRCRSILSVTPDENPHAGRGFW